MKREDELLKSLALKVKEGGPEGVNAAAALEAKCKKLGLNIEDYIEKKYIPPPPVTHPPQFVATTYIKNGVLYMMAGGKWYKTGIPLMEVMDQGEVWR